MAPPILKLEAVSLSFGGTPLLDGVDLQVEPGDRICLVGRNGSGKSTLLKIAAGQVEPQSGEIFRHPSSTVRYLSQSPDFEGFDTVRAYAEAGLGPADDLHRVTYLLDQLGLTGEENPASLSGGEARRAALARALAPDPDILLLDEPTNHLDLPAIEWLEEEIRRMKSAVLVISHDRRFLERVSRLTLWLDRGRAQRLEKDFSHFEAWRDEVLEAEAVEQRRHRLLQQAGELGVLAARVHEPVGVGFRDHGLGRAARAGAREPAVDRPPPVAPVKGHAADVAQLVGGAEQLGFPAPPGHHARDLPLGLAVSPQPEAPFGGARRGGRGRQR